MNNMKIRQYIYIILLLAGGMIHSGTLKAQGKTTATTIMGIVVDKDNNPVADVAVSIQEERGEVITGKDGKFEIVSKDTRKDLLVFEKPGYARVEMIAIDSKANIILETTTVEMGISDDVNIPFGVRKKREISSAICQLDMNTMPHNLTGSLTNYLMGRLPGLYVADAGNVPGNNDSYILSRGLNAFPVYGGSR